MANITNEDFILAYCLFCTRPFRTMQDFETCLRVHTEEIRQSRANQATDTFIIKKEHESPQFLLDADLQNNTKQLNSTEIKEELQDIIEFEKEVKVLPTAFSNGIRETEVTKIALVRVPKTTATLKQFADHLRKERKAIKLDPDYEFVWRDNTSSSFENSNSCDTSISSTNDLMLQIKRIPTSVPLNLQFHQLAQHPRNDEKCFECDHCPYKTVRKNYLQRHIFRHVRYKDFKCEVCKSFYATPDLLQRHKHRVHDGSRPDRMTRLCEFCDTILQYPSSYIRHKKEFHKPNSHQCPRCRAAVGTVEKLKQHMIVHR